MEFRWHILSSYVTKAFSTTCEVRIDDCKVSWFSSCRNSAVEPWWLKLGALDLIYLTTDAVFFSFLYVCFITTKSLDFYSWGKHIRAICTAWRSVEVKDQLCVWLALINKESGYKHENRSLIQSLALMRLAIIVYGWINSRESSYIFCMEWDLCSKYWQFM